MGVYEEFPKKLQKKGEEREVADPQESIEETPTVVRKVDSLGISYGIRTDFGLLEIFFQFSLNSLAVRVSHNLSNQVSETRPSEWWRVARCPVARCLWIGFTVKPMRF